MTSPDKSTTFMFADDPQMVLSLEEYNESQRISCTTVLWMVLCPACIGNPLRDSARRKELLRSILTFTMVTIAIQSLLLFLMLVIAGFDDYTDNVAWGPTKETLITWGALNADKVMHCAELWRIFSALWLNAGIFQLLMNAFFLLRIGLFVEYKWRWIRYAAIYTISGVGGGLLSMILQPNSTSVSSTSAVCGIIAAYMCEVIFTWYKTEGVQRIITLTVCITFLVAAIIFGFVSPYMDNTSTIGGVGLGFLLGVYYSLIESDFPPNVKLHVPNTILVIITIYFVAGVTVFYVLVQVATRLTC
eukprot:CAMPEP_0119141884 /NCGR_PEP_ID=MMETSP1310-20130426/31735_1 /TAXON_ID=464262 /ORGANISM="Genus nov. species nov., Strain RCC2339" /LENGTH=302 /DNA_ID=CAMNT_0007133375 /DNA_START=4 /DNA_END=912 /DNA_ORIENTATION=+